MGIVLCQGALNIIIKFVNDDPNITYTFASMDKHVGYSIDLTNILEQSIVCR